MALTTAASVELEPIWATLLAKALEGKNVKELLSNVGSGGGAPAVGAAPAAGGGAGAAAAEAPKEEEKKEEEKEESDDDMVRYPNILHAFMLLMLGCLRRASVSSINFFVFLSFCFPSACLHPIYLAVEFLTSSAHCVVHHPFLLRTQKDVEKHCLLYL